MDLRPRNGKALQVEGHKRLGVRSIYQMIWWQRGNKPPLGAVSPFCKIRVLRFEVLRVLEFAPRVPLQVSKTKKTPTTTTTFTFSFLKPVSLSTMNGPTNNPLYSNTTYTASPRVRPLRSTNRSRCLPDGKVRTRNGSGPGLFFIKATGGRDEHLGWKLLLGE